MSLEGNKIKSLIPEELVYNVSDPRMPSSIDKHVKDMVAYLSR